MIWEVPGVRVGNWTDADARTGCTVVLFDPPAVASGEVRGGAPATRDFSLLDPTATVARIDAVVLSGGSAFGLAAADGVMSWCEAQDRGYATPGGRVPIVVGMSLYDLGVGDASVRPGPAEGIAACDAAPERLLGAVGAGTGATVGSWRGSDRAMPGGLVGAVERDGELIVAALVAVNPWGDVVGHGHHGEPDPAPVPPTGPTNTIIGVVATNAALDPTGCQQLCRGAHDGLARAVEPPHSSRDGDAFVAVATGDIDAAAGVTPDRARLLAVRAVDRAIRSLAPGR